MPIIKCKSCGTRVVPMADNSCPSCRQPLADSEDVILQPTPPLPSAREDSHTSAAKGILSVQSMSVAGVTSDDLECPNGHGTLRLWEGQLRCWKCGYRAGGVTSQELSTQTPACAICNSTSLGVSPSLREWLQVQKTGQVKRTRCEFTGIPMGGSAQITAYQVEVINSFTTAVCDQCKHLDSTKAEKEYNTTLARNIATRKHFTNACRIAAVVSVAIAICTAVVNVRDSWDNPNLQIVFALALLASILTTLGALGAFAEGPAPKPAEDDLESIKNAHHKQIGSRALALQSGQSTRILVDDDCPLDHSGRCFVIAKDRFENDQCNGYGLFVLEKRMFEPGGSRAVFMALSELRAIAADHLSHHVGNKSIGKWILERGD